MGLRCCTSRSRLCGYFAYDSETRAVVTRAVFFDRNQVFQDDLACTDTDAGAHPLIHACVCAQQAAMSILYDKDEAEKLDVAQIHALGLNGLLELSSVGTQAHTMSCTRTHAHARTYAHARTG
eukprot:1651261-Pleurochrysis_carterae.AAC.2